MLGGLRGPMGATGGLWHTYGLSSQFTKPPRDGPPPRLSRAGVRRICGYFRPYIRYCAVILLTIGLSAGLKVLPPLCVKQILDRAMPQEDLALLGALAGAMLGVAVVAGLLDVLQHTLTARMGQGVMFDLRGELFRKLQGMSLHFYTATRAGEIVSRINNDVGAVQGVATSTLVSVAGNAATLAATAAALFWINWKLALTAVIIVPVFYLPSKIVGGIRRRLSAETQEGWSALHVFMSERLHVSGALLTKIFGQADADGDRFTERSARLRDLSVKQAVVGRWLFMILTVLGALGPALIYWYGGYQVIRDELTVGMLVAFAALLMLLYRPLVRLASVYADLQAAAAVFERIFGYLDMEPEVQDRPDARALPSTTGHLVFEHVCFAYPVAPRAEAASNPRGSKPDPFALRDVSFEILPGQRVALVGPSGAGKTTITYLVPRFYDPVAGRLTLDGRDLREYRQDDLRRHVGMVTQETHMFHASVRDNLLYARPEAGEAELVAACRAAQIHDFIQGLPDRYDTVVGERGFRLSGGEKQRVSIARALLKGAPILILDEPTSNLDATSEFLVKQALDKLLRDRTSLIIAHRLSTILSADRIVVLEAGRVVQVGRHAELVEQEGLYAMLFKQQFGGVLDADAERRAAGG